MRCALGVVAALAAAAGVAAQSDNSLCQWADPSSGATFDLSPLNTAVSRGRGWTVRDGRQNVASGNYTYTFNVCGNLDTSLFSSTTYSTCNVTYDHPSNFPNLRLCQRLGQPVNDSNIAYAPLSATNPSRGVKMTYTGGDSCGDAGERSFTLAVQCADNTDNVPDLTETVEETASCHYEVFFRSVYGCPEQCTVVGPAGAGRLCNGQGVCDFDSGLNRPRCFCNPGWEGAGCESKHVEESKPPVSAIGVVLIIVCIVMLFAGALLWTLWTKVRSLRLDMSAYKSLAADDELSSAAPAAAGAATLTDD